MKRSTIFQLTRLMAVLAVVLLAALTTGQLVQAGGNPNPGVLPPGSKPYGATYGEWSARWWQWALGQPVPTNPLLDPTGADCKVGQAGPVWFLGGTWSGGSATRTCAIAAGKALFFPLVNAVDIHVPGDGLGTYEKLRQDLLSFFGPITELHASVDGIPVSNLNPQTTPYHACAGGARECAPGFIVTLPGENLFSGFGVGAGDYPAVAYGFYLMLTPLSAGRHTIKFGGKYFFAGSESLQEITYHLTVGP